MKRVVLIVFCFCFAVAFSFSSSSFAITKPTEKKRNVVEIGGSGGPGGGGASGKAAKISPQATNKNIGPSGKYKIHNVEHSTT